MENFFLAASVVVPLLVYMVVGGIIRKLSIFSLENFKALNVMIFRIFIPLTLFFDVYGADLGDIIQPSVFAFVFIGILLVFTLAWLVFSKTVKEQADAATMIQGVYRSNYVLFGSTIAFSLCGESGLALVAALAAMVVPLFNILAVTLFEVKRGGNVKVREIVINIFKNPLVDAGILGCLFSGFGISIPELLAKPLIMVGDIATPLALITLGGMLSFGSMVKHRRYLLEAVLGRLVLVPFFALAVAICLGFRGDAIVASLAVFGSPTAVASTPMAQAMGGNATLAGEIVAITSVCSIITIFLFVFGLYGFGLIG